jgi:hypothetical protein
MGTGLRDAAGGWGRHLELDRQVPLFNVEQLPSHDMMNGTGGLPPPQSVLLKLPCHWTGGMHFCRFCMGPILDSYSFCGL